MSREVEVTGIKMTATVPEDLQLSLGMIGNAYGTTGATEANKVSLANSTGFLTYVSDSADDGKVAIPTKNGWDWSNSANISAYYDFGKLMPASSTTGEKIYFTADASGVGRTVKGDAKYFIANDAAAPLSALTEKATVRTAASDTNTLKATLHAYRSDDDKDATKSGAWKNATDGAYKVASAWNDTKDDGYYVDIPVWIRSSGSQDTNIQVDGYVLPGSTDDTNGKTETQLELYRSVRVAILNGDTAGTAKAGGGYNVVTTGSPVVNDVNVLSLVDAWDTTDTNSYTTTNGENYFKSITTKSNPYTLAATDTAKRGILDSGIYDERLKLSGDAAGKLWAVSALTTYAVDTDYTKKTETVAPTYSNYTQYTPETTIATIKAPTDGSEYGEMKKLIIRVWIDGEDEQCWNDNAGQDWAISLKFSKVE